MPIIGLLGVAFIILKLVHVIAWSWLWVLAPFWIPFAVWLVIALIGLLAVLSQTPAQRAIRRYTNALKRR